ncbi:MAG: ABC transporter permease subunit [Phoenicibacter congonensis]|uniref:ABC transporter permease subunit n=1 Tax=Phoenicibacter congonensis TaxID=1944646 RepID=A0AA43RL72_9ACTN|nr:ABC transporter permease subunit [Phoenicibacter congonensis]
MQFLMEPSRRLTTPKEFIMMLLPVSGILFAMGSFMLLPNVYPEEYVPETYFGFLIGCMIVYLVLLVIACFWPYLRKKLVYFSGIILVAFIALVILDILTLKSGILQLPFIPSPDKTLSCLTLYPDKVIPSFFASMQLLLTGILIGAVTGFLTGVIMGWSRVCNYWLSPVLKLIGPVPSAAWLPIAVVIMPTNHAAGLFLIALSVWFPLTLMLSSAIRSTNVKLVEAARVMGASETYILFHVALPNALPAIFDGLFMGLSGSFGALVVAEMLGVKEGLGWYLNWAKSWSDYGRVFSTTAIFIIIFFVLIELLFWVRKKVLKWQNGLVRW